MPVKVRCPSCRKVLTAPDKARGKALRCPNCEGRVSVPSGNRSAAAGRKKRVRRSADDDDFLGGVDLNRLEDSSQPVCPRCGATTYEDDVLCPECGVNLATGRMPEKKRKGPAPSAFYSEAWADSWAFLMENKGLAGKTGSVWTMFIVLYVCMALLTGAAIRWEAGKILAAAEETVEESGPPPGVEEEEEAEAEDNPELREAELIVENPELATVKAIPKPPVIFCGFLTLLSALGYPGWYWFAASKVIETTMHKKKQKRMKTVQFDFFQTVVTGFKAYFWPWVLLMPVFFAAAFAIIPMSIAAATLPFGLGRLGAVGIALVPVGIYMIPLFVFPIAQVHMTMRYTYKAFLPWDMLSLFFKHAGPALYWLLMAVATTLPVAVILIVLLVLFGNELAPRAVGALQSIVAWIVEKIGEDPEQKNFIYKAIFFTVGFVLLTVVAAAFSYAMAFPAVFLMRANGLFGYYNRRTLELVGQQKPNVPCGFWVRYLATLIDMLILSLIMIGLQIVIGFAIGALSGIGLTYLAALSGLIYLGVSILLPMWYYTKSESGIFQGTLGKRSLGIVVTNLEGKPIGMKQAMGRFWGKFLSSILFGAGFIMAAFTENKQTLHDQLSKTLVVWQGDDERT